MRKSFLSVEKPLQNLLDTARSLGATRFVDYVIDSGLGPQLTQSHSPLTVFAPTNEAFEVLKYINHH